SDPPGTGAGLAHQAARHRTGHAVVRAADGRAAAVALRRADAPARCAGRGAARRWETTHGLPARRPARRSPGGAAAVDAARNPPMTTLLPRELLLPLTAELRKVLTLRWCVLLAARLPAIALAAATGTSPTAGHADPGGPAAADAARTPPMPTRLPGELLLPRTAELRKVLTLRWCVLLAALLPAIALVAATVTALMAGQADPRAQPVTGAATIGLLLA